MPDVELLAVAAEYERTGRLAEPEWLLGHIFADAPDRATHCTSSASSRCAAVDAAIYWRSICEVLRVQGHLDGALAAGRQAMALGQDDPTASPAHSRPRRWPR